LESKELAKGLPRYVKDGLISTVSRMSGCKDGDWKLLKKSMRETFDDEETFKYSLTDLKRFARDRKRRGKPETMAEVSRVYLKFVDISTYLKNSGVIGPQEESRRFLQLLPSHIVESIFERSDARNLFSELDGDESKDDACLLPGIDELLKEVRAVFAGLARRGKSSSNWSRCQQDSSDMESDSDSESIYQNFLDAEKEESTHRSKRYPSSSSNSKATKTQCRDGFPSKAEGEMEACLDEGELEDDGINANIKDLFSRFEELQLSVNRLVVQQAVTYHPLPTAPMQKDSRGPTNKKSASRRRSSRNPEHQNPKVSTPTPLAEPIISFTYESNSATLDLDSLPNPFKPEGILDLANKTSVCNSWKRGGPGGTHIDVTCFWCKSEEDRHHMRDCRDLSRALRERIIWKDQRGKLRYQGLYIPAQKDPRGMRGWVNRKQALETPKESVPLSVKDLHEKFGQNLKGGRIAYQGLQKALPLNVHQEGGQRASRRGAPPDKTPSEQCLLLNPPLKSSNPAESLDTSALRPEGKVSPPPSPHQINDQPLPIFEAVNAERWSEIEDDQLPAIPSEWIMESLPAAKQNPATNPARHELPHHNHFRNEIFRPVTKKDLSELNRSRRGTIFSLPYLTLNGLKGLNLPIYPRVQTYETFDISVRSPEQAAHSEKSDLQFFDSSQICIGSSEQAAHCSRVFVDSRVSDGLSEHSAHGDNNDLQSFLLSHVSDNTSEQSAQSDSDNLKSFKTSQVSEVSSEQAAQSETGSIPNLKSSQHDAQRKICKNFISARKSEQAAHDGNGSIRDVSVTWCKSRSLICNRNVSCKIHDVRFGDEPAERGAHSQTCDRIEQSRADQVSSYKSNGGNRTLEDVHRGATLSNEVFVGDLELSGDRMKGTRALQNQISGSAWKESKSTYRVQEILIENDSCKKEISNKPSEVRACDEPSESESSCNEPSGTGIRTQRRASTTGRWCKVSIFGLVVISLFSIGLFKWNKGVPVAWASKASAKKADAYSEVVVC
ncbi:hypothetical protein P7C70_g8592, partial [Phenoliferia sp. Uapishka_3]